VTPVKVLLVEDEPGYARLVSEILTESGEHRVTWVMSLAEALPLLDTDVTDVVLLDLGLPDAVGMEAVVQVRAAATAVPIVVLSSQGSLDIALESMREGAQEYLVKGQAEHHLLARTVRYAVERKRSQDFEQLLIGVVGHDLRNPLQTIVLASQPLLYDAALPAEHRDRVTRIASAASRASSLVHDLLDLTRIRFLGKALPIERKAVDVTAIVRQAVGDARLANGDGRIVFDGDAPVFAQVDPGRIAQVVTNLVVNALNHGDARTPVTVRLGKQEDALVLEVHNDGPRIPLEVQRKVFEPLRRATPQNRAEQRPSEHAATGLGLGLYIVREIVTAHGGLIEVSSADGDGTTFRVVIPPP
jgi:signal transduction histidine kinase